MPIKDKKVIAQSKKRNKPGHKNVLDIIDKIFFYWSFKHLKSLIKKKDTPEKERAELWAKIVRMNNKQQGR